MKRDLFDGAPPVLYADRALEAFGRRLGLVLVVASARVFARRPGDCSVPHALRSVSARDGRGDDQRLMMHERLANRTTLSMCRTWDIDEPTRDATTSESLVFASIC